MWPRPGGAPVLGAGGRITPKRDATRIVLNNIPQYFFIMSYWVNILFSQRIVRYYTGHSTNPEIRLQYHNLGLTPSTKKGFPWSSVWSTDCKTKSEAVALEQKIKKRGAKRFLEDLQKGNIP